MGPETNCTGIGGGWHDLAEACGAKSCLLRSELDTDGGVVWPLGMEAECALLKVEAPEGRGDGPTGLVFDLIASGYDAHFWSPHFK